MVNVVLESKPLSYLTNKMGLFQNNTGIAIQGMQALTGKSGDQRRGMINYRDKEVVGSGFLNESPLEKGEGSEW